MLGGSEGIEGCKLGMVAEAEALAHSVELAAAAVHNFGEHRRAAAEVRHTAVGVGPRIRVAELEGSDGQAGGREAGRRTVTEHHTGVVALGRHTEPVRRMVAAARSPGEVRRRFAAEGRHIAVFAEAGRRKAVPEEVAAGSNPPAEEGAGRKVGILGKTLLEQTEVIQCSVLLS